MMQWIRHVLPFVTKTHKLVFRATFGRIGSVLPGMRFLMLEHTGRRTGQARTTPILCFEDGDRFVIVASNAGRDQHPAWWFNLQARPEVTVGYGSERIAVTARRAEAGEAERLWLLAEQSYRWFPEYRAGTEREIPIVILEPLEPRKHQDPFYGRVAVVTGAASGVGRALAEQLAVRGCRLALVDVNSEGMREVASRLEDLGCDVSTHPADVSNASVMEALPREINTRHGAIHILVNNAGVTVAARFEDHSLEELRWLVGINLWGVLHGCHFFLPYLQQQPGAKLVNIASSTALLGLPGQSVYSATKGAVRGLSEALVGELRGEPVAVTSIYPGGIRTGLFRAARGSNSEAMASVGETPFSRTFRSPEQVAKAVLRAVERGRTRKLIGWDAYLSEWLWRISPALAIRATRSMQSDMGAGDAERAKHAGVRTVEVTHLFSASPQQLWDVFTDHASWGDWAGTPGAKLVTPGSQDRNGVGAVRGFAGGVREEVLSFDPPKRMTYTVTAGLFPVKDHEGEVLFEADGEETLVTWRCRFRSKVPGLGAALERVSTRTFTRGLAGLEEHSFPRLK
jgi:deazaflavin-dependent oxidoreductase (nitroreductase family)